MAQQGWRARRAERRVRAGDGRPLPRFRWWQLLSRSLLTLTLRAPDGVASTYAVDIRHLGDGHDGAVRARLYVDDALTAHSTLPARFPVPGGHIEVDAGTYGLRRCHYVQPDGAEHRLTPHHASAAGRRAALERTRPRTSRLVGAVATLLVLCGLAVAVPQLVETISQVPLIADRLGTFDSPIRLSAAQNVVVGLVAVLGSTERALRFRAGWLDSLAS